VLAPAEIVEFRLQLRLKQGRICCNTISVDGLLLQNCWQPNFIYVMLRSRSRSEILERLESMSDSEVVERS